MAGIHRSSTLEGGDDHGRAPAGDGRDSPLKYTSATRSSYLNRAGDGRDSPLKYTTFAPVVAAACAGDGRDSPLKYTLRVAWTAFCALGMAGIHRSSTLAAQQFPRCEM